MENTSVELAKKSQKSVMRKLLELYAHDFSEFDGLDINEYGEYGYPYLDCYWNEKGRFPYLFFVNENIAGFGLIRIDEEGYFSVAEFFILRKYRKLGYGEFYAKMLFKKHEGNWRVSVLDCNQPAIHFWKKVIVDFSGGEYHVAKMKDWDGPVFEFKNGN